MKKNKDIEEKSDCCNASVMIQGDTTMHHECIKCGEPCDICDIGDEDECIEDVGPAEDKFLCANSVHKDIQARAVEEYKKELLKKLGELPKTTDLNYDTLEEITKLITNG